MVLDVVLASMRIDGLYLQYDPVVRYYLSDADCCNNSKKKRVSYLHRTATTTYPCSIPRLGGSVGAGRVRLTRAQKYKKNVSLQKKKNKCERKLLTYVPYSL